MPDINQDLRDEVDKLLQELTNKLIQKYDENLLPGMVNYCISKMLWSLCGEGHPGGVQRYHRMNAMIGALQCAQLELYRRVIAPYEDEKIKESGDII